MTKNVPYAKRSKSERRKEDARKRVGWGQTNPVTKIVQSKKVYSRKVKHKGQEND